MKNTINQIDLTNICGTVNPKTAHYIFFLSAHKRFSRINLLLGHKTSVNKFMKIEIILSMSSDHNGMKSEINNRRKFAKYTNM